MSIVSREQRLLYSLLIESSLSEAARKAIQMQQPEVKRWFNEAQRENYERGVAAGRASALVKILDRRGLTVTADQQRRIVGCTDLAMLEQWLDLAFTVSSPEQLFE